MSESVFRYCDRVETLIGIHQRYYLRLNFFDYFLVKDRFVMGLQLLITEVSRLLLGLITVFKALGNMPDMRELLTICSKSVNKLLTHVEGSLLARCHGSMLKA